MGSAPPHASNKNSEQIKQLLIGQNTALQKQLGLLDTYQQQYEQQLKTQDLLAPILYQQYGLKPIYKNRAPTQENFNAAQYLSDNPDVAANGYDPWQHYQEHGQFEPNRGNPFGQELTGFDQSMTPEQQQAKDIQTLSQARTLAALKGELPIDAGLLQDLDTQAQKVNDTLFKQLGPGYETSTPGIQALSQFQKYRTSALDAARRGDLTTAGNLQLAQSQLNAGNQAQQYNAFMNTANWQGNPSPLAQLLQGYSQLGQGYNNPLSFYQGQQQQRTSASIAGTQNSQGGINAGIGAAGALAALLLL